MIPLHRTFCCCYCSIECVLRWIECIELSAGNWFSIIVICNSILFSCWDFVECVVCCCDEMNSVELFSITEYMAFNWKFSWKFSAMEREKVSMILIWLWHRLTSELMHVAVIGAHSHPVIQDVCVSLVDVPSVVIDRWPCLHTELDSLDSISQSGSRAILMDIFYCSEDSRAYTGENGSQPMSNNIPEGRFYSINK